MFLCCVLCIHCIDVHDNRYTYLVFNGYTTHGSLQVLNGLCYAGIAPQGEHRYT
jgi:hypothetical protein